MGVVTQEHTTPRTVSKRLNVTRVLQSWKVGRLTSITKDVDLVRTSPLSVRCCSHFYTRTKWQVGAAKYRKENLEELRVGLRDHCEKSLREFSHDLAISALLEFGKETAKVRSPSSFCVTVTYLTIYFLRLICSANVQSGKKHKAWVEI